MDKSRSNCCTLCCLALYYGGSREGENEKHKSDGSKLVAAPVLRASRSKR
jgi:hypothetical protein